MTRRIRYVYVHQTFPGQQGPGELESIQIAEGERIINILEYGGQGPRLFQVFIEMRS